MSGKRRGVRDDGVAGDGDPERRDAPELAREEARATVKKGGRLAFHVTVTLAAAVVAGGAEALGNVLFRGGNDLLGMTIEGAVFGLLIGNLLALWLWPKMVDRA